MINGSARRFASQIRRTLANANIEPILDNQEEVREKTLIVYGVGHRDVALYLSLVTPGEQDVGPAANFGTGLRPGTDVAILVGTDQG